ncbi:MAG: ASKHA domain-containing protein [Acidiferrobacterales bacterium]|nr:ASKHA domain-containing protein [Acidiferrobacterales bacterium]
MLDKISVTFNNSDNNTQRTVQAERDLTILDAARAAGVEIDATCGSRGRCRSCRVKILKGDTPPPTVQDTIQLGHDEVQEGFRLSCQTRMLGDTIILPMPPKAEEGHQILESAGSGADNAHLQLDCGIAKTLVKANAPVEEHHQTSDVEEIVAAMSGLTDESVPLDVIREIPQMLRKERGNITVATFNGKIIDVEAGDTTDHVYGMAFDIGTTSVVGTLLDLHTGEQLASAGGVNAQSVYGGDLMSRIAYAQFDQSKLSTLRAKILNQVNKYVRQCSREAKIDPRHIYKIVVVGNTCMHHIFLGIDVSYVGLAPYAPVVRDNVTFPASDLPLKGAPNAQICMLPIIAGFVGADTVGCILSTRIYESDEIRALVDIGTNGEVVMGSRERLTACSAPAGPALEGAQIRDGMRGAMGAIEKVEISDDFECSVIGDVPAIGICGSGLIDAAAKMIESKVMDCNGKMRKHDLECLPEKIRCRLARGSNQSFEFVLVWEDDSGRNQNIAVTQADVRQLQLAKSAIYSGIRMLQSVMHVSDDEITELMLCGGFGNYVNIESAKTIRLLPDLRHEHISYIGNAALLGAQMALLSETERLNASEIIKQIEHVALAARPDFQDIFIDSMAFKGDSFTPPKSSSRKRKQGRSRQTI